MSLWLGVGSASISSTDSQELMPLLADCWLVLCTEESTAIVRRACGACRQHCHTGTSTTISWYVALAASTAFYTPETWLEHSEPQLRAQQYIHPRNLFLSSPSCPLLAVCITTHNAPHPVHDHPTITHSNQLKIMQDVNPRIPNSLR